MYRPLRVIGIVTTVILCGTWWIAPARTQTPPTMEPKDAREMEALRLADIEAHLAQPLQREHLAVLRTEDGILVQKHLHNVKVHLTSKTGKEAPRLTNMVVPDADGVRLTLQVLSGHIVTQAVRPQDLHQHYRTQSGKRIELTTYLDQFWFKKANFTLLLNLDYGAQISRKQVDTIVAAVRNYATSQGGTEGRGI